MKVKDMNVGQFAAWYTLTGWFCTVKTAFDIDKVRFDFVKSGTGGQENFSIYVGTDQFDLLCDDILSFRFAKKLEADKANDYPKAWEYITGAKAALELHIGAGKNTPIVIQGRDKTKKNANCFVGVPSYDELRIMAKDFRRLSGTHFQKKCQKCLEEAGKYHNPTADEADAAGAAADNSNEPLY